MVLLVELLLGAGVLFGVYRVATRPADGMAAFEPDRTPSERRDGPLTADELVTMHIPMGFGYRKVDVDRLLDRIARQLPRAVYEPSPETQDAPLDEDAPLDQDVSGAQGDPQTGDGDPAPSLSLEKESNSG